MTATLNKPTPQRRRADRPLDPHRAEWVNEVLVEGVWRQIVRYPASDPKIGWHQITSDPDGGRACCDCLGFLHYGYCKHATAAAELLRHAAANTYCDFDLATLQALNADMIRQFGPDGLRDNLRYSALGDAVCAATRRQDAPTAIANGKRAGADLFEEAS